MHFWFWYSIFSCFSKCLILNCFSSLIDFSLQSHMTHNCWSTINNIMSGQRNPHFVSIRESFFLNMFPLTIPFLIFATNYGFSPSTCLTHPLFYQIPSFPSFHSLYKITAHPPASKTMCFSCPFPQGSSLVLASTTIRSCCAHLHQFSLRDVPLSPCTNTPSMRFLCCPSFLRAGLPPSFLHLGSSPTLSPHVTYLWVQHLSYF